MMSRGVSSASARGTPEPVAEGNASTTAARHQKEDQPSARTIAELALSSAVPCAITAKQFVDTIAGGGLDLPSCVGVVRDAAKAVQAGDLSGLEATLASQAIALDAIFNEMARRTAVNMGEHLGAAETYLRLGLKAQAQCRATAQTLFEMKNPQPIAFVKQANISNGPQQVNNVVVKQPPTRAGISADQSNELLGLNHEQRLDIGATGAAGRTDRRLETVGAILRSED
jgi:hypothetical protein